ncbi:MAG: M48 family metalloprotease [Bacteroidetes bacterium]|nr:M48 family metalloprotease [Bacteroidota bacterium]
MENKTLLSLEKQKRIEKKYELSQQNLSPNKKTKADNLFEKRKNNIITDLKEEKLVLGTPYNAILEKVFERIKQKNSEYDFSNIDIILGKSSIPNAYSIGEGTIVVNVGLLAFLENESQLAFVICHEIAHYFLNHGDIELLKLTNELNELRTGLKEVNSASFKKNQQRINIILNYHYRKMSQSRQNEFSADSLGYILLDHTDFNHFASKNCLINLQRIESWDSTITLNFHKVFDSNQFKFNDNLLKKNITGFGFKTKMDDKTNTDSLSSHPDFDLRIKKLEKDFLFAKNISTREKNEDFLEDLNEKVEFEVIDILFKNKDFPASINNTLKLLNKYPENVYLNKILIQTLAYIYSDKVNHEFNDDLGKYYSKKDPNLEAIINLLKNANLIDLINMMDSFIQRDFEKSPNREDKLLGMYLLSNMTKNGTEIEFWKTKLIEKFPQYKTY